MTTFDDRDRAFENKYAHDQELQFKVMARRNKLLGLWAAAKLGKSTGDADAYAKEVVMSDFEEAGDDDVLRKVLGDLTAGGISITDVQLRAEMNRLLGEAKLQIMSETK